MAPDPIDRRGFLALSGGALLCTLAGQEVGDRRRQDRRRGARPRGEGAAEGGGGGVARRRGGRERPGGAAERRHDARVLDRRRAGGVEHRPHPPRPDDGREGKAGKDHASAPTATAPTRPGFKSPLGQATVPGPLIEAEVGDTVVVHFRNKLGAPVTMHPHGIFYAERDGRRLQGRSGPTPAASSSATAPSPTSGRRAKGPRAPGSTTTTGRWTRCRSSRACSGRW